MAGTVKGITIKFDGDTTGLNRALGQINKATRGTQSSLRDVNRALKLDPTNINLITQKQTLLRQRVDGAKQKLEQLKDVQNQLDAKGVDKTSKEYLEVSRKIEQAKQEVQQFQKELNALKSPKLEQIGQKFNQAGEKMTAAGRKIAPVSAAVAGVGAVSVHTTAQFDSSMSRVSAVAGATGKDFEALRNKAIEMGNKTKFSASESADAMNYMAMAGWKTEDMLSGIKGVMDLAAASGEDLATTSDIVTDALTAFGLSAKDSSHFADVLATASANSNTNVQMLGESFKYAAPVAGSLGYSVEDTTEALGLMANQGIKSTQAGTSLRTIMQGLSKDFTVSGKSIGNVRIQTTNADGSMRSLKDILGDTRDAFSGLSESEKVSAAKTLVGKNAMSGFLALMNSSDKDIGKLETALGSADGAAGKMASTMQDNLSGAVTSLKSKAETLAIRIGDNLTPYVRAAAEWLGRLADKFSGMSPAAQKAVTGVGVFVAALGPALLIGGKIAGTIGKTIDGFQKLSGAITSLGGLGTIASGIGAKVSGALSVMIGPVGLVVAAIGAVIAAFVYLYNNNKQFKEKINQIWNQIKLSVQQFVNAVKAELAPFAGEFKAICNTIKTVWRAVAGILAPVFITAFGIVKTVVQSALNIILGTIKVFSGLIRGDWSTVWSGIKKITKGAWSGIKAAISAPLKLIRALVLSILNAIKSKMISAWNTIKSRTSAAWNSIKEKITGPFTKARDKIKGIVDKIKGWFPISIGKIFKNIKLPSFSLEEGSKTYKKLGSISYPKSMGVSWHRKGGIFDRPTLLAGGTHGVGEAGAEAVVPLATLWDQLGQKMNQMGDNITNGIITALAIQGGTAGQPIVIQNFLYPSGPKLGETIVDLYDTYKHRLG